MRMEMRKRDKIVCLITVSLFLALSASYAQNKAQEAVNLEKLSREYISKNDYDGFYQYLIGLLKESHGKTAETYFYLADTRQRQVLYWQRTKNWEGVYDKAAHYKEEIAANLDKAEHLVKNDPNLLLKIKYDQWLAVKDDDPDRAGVLFNDLVKMAQAEAKGASALELTRQIADELSSLEDKNLSRRLYEVYAARISESGLSGEELKSQAEQFLAQGNVYLAKSFFGTYLDNLALQKEKLAKAYIEVADQFAHPGTKDGIDPFYAESLYQKACEIAADKAFTADSQYRRAFNLERMKEFESSFAQYKHLLSIYPDYPQKPKIFFRLGVLAAYALKDIDVALGYFSKIKDEFPKERLAASSLYQLGILSQWKNDTDKAKEFYNAFLKTAQEQGLDLEKDELVLIAKERLQEITDQKEMKYPLRLFFEGIFKKAAGKEPFSMITIDLTAQPSRADVGQSIKYAVTMSNPQTGCMTPVYSYEWSGETGGLVNIPNSPELITSFSSQGIKITQVAVVGPDGPQGVAFEMVEID